MSASLESRFADRTEAPACLQARCFAWKVLRIVATDVVEWGTPEVRPVLGMNMEMEMVLEIGMV